MEKVVLAYSGGLDTSAAIRWLQERYNVEIICLTIDLGNNRDLQAAQQKALKVGAIKALVVDARDLFIKHFVFPALQANALYEGQYPLATALGRPLIAKLLVDVARDEGASYIAHGCTGKGNDQVRFDVSTAALAPDLKVLAPAREWGMTREETIAYANKHGIPVPTTVANPYSTDENLWGRSIECGILEDPWNEPPADAYAWTKAPEECPEEPAYIEIEFERGVPIALNGKPMGGVSLVADLSELAGNYGVGRIDHIENRLVGIKSREIYEAPAAVVLLKAHEALEAMTLSKDQMRFKQKIAIEYADMIYNGLWFSAYHQDMAAYIQSTQRFVTGMVRVKLHKGNCSVVGRKAERPLYNLSLATYDKDDQFDHSAAVGFIKLWGLPLRTQAQAQLLGQGSELLGIMPPKINISEQ